MKFSFCLLVPELKLDLDIVDFDAASSGSEEELCKLIVVCMVGRQEFQLNITPIYFNFIV